MSFECQNEHLKLLHKLYNRRLTSFPVRLFWVVKFKIWRYLQQWKVLSTLLAVLFSFNLMSVWHLGECALFYR